MAVDTNTQLNYAWLEIPKKFKEIQQTRNDNMKAIATNLAMTEMKLNKWYGNEDQWQSIYEGVWVEKFMFVETYYNTQQILDISKKLLKGQRAMITYLGIIVSNTGQILKNQEIIITNQGLILDVTNAIYEDVQDIKATTEIILGTVQDIQGTVNSIQANGVKILRNDYSGPGGGGLSKYIGIVAGILGSIILLVIVLRLFKKKK